jgi:hypothetical protein
MQTAKSDKLKCNKVTKTVAYSGSCAFMFRGNADGSSSKLQQKITETDGFVNSAVVTFSAYIDPRSAVPGTTVGKTVIKYTNSSKPKLELQIPAGVGNYTQINAVNTLSLPIGVNISKVKAQFKYSETTGKFYVDDVSLGLTTIDATSTRIPITTISIFTATSTNTSSDTPTNTAINTHTATRTYTSPPTFTPTNTPVPLPLQLIARDGAADDCFSCSVSLSNDGNTALIGANNHTVDSNFKQGSAYIFKRNNTVWTEQTQFTADNGTAEDEFGILVSLSGDGRTALIGVSAWVFSLA